ncbi:MAG: hypothetical protein LBR39_04210 [Coriobacteriales bacterium]|nr:hypothetical protein [Coriobacteriales bacterium]
MADLRAEMTRFAEANGHPLSEAHQIVCAVCGSSLFKLETDAAGNGVAARCLSCPKYIYIQGSQSRLVGDLEECLCDCGNNELQVMMGTSCQPDSSRAEWVYVGGYCPSCGMVATYVDWGL